VTRALRRNSLQTILLAATGTASFSTTMAFFSGLSSSIGKRLLLYGLRHIDILDKDPADFVSVDVGKRTTLEVRDVGLNVKVCRARWQADWSLH
jgi:hypothetical protein